MGVVDDTGSRDYNVRVRREWHNLHRQGRVHRLTVYTLFEDTSKSLVAIAILVGILAVLAVACGGGDDEAAAPAAPAAAAAPAAPAAAAAPAAPAAAAAPAQEATAEPPAATDEPTSEETTRYKGGLVPVDELVPLDLSKDGDVIDLTVKLHDGTMYIYGTPPMRYEPKDMTFKLGQTVNFTLEFADPNSKFKHSFTSFDLGFDEVIKYGQTLSFTHTFDKAGFFFVRSTSHHQMTGTITVVE